MRLPQILDLAAAAPLRGDLLRLRGAPLELDASNVERLGGLSLQVLRAASQTWGADQQSFRIVSPSPAFDEAARLMGAHEFCAEGGDAL
jgi:chemotaxis protein CheX